MRDYPRNLEASRRVHEYLAYNYPLHLHHQLNGALGDESSRISYTYTITGYWIRRPLSNPRLRRLGPLAVSQKMAAGRDRIA